MGKKNMASSQIISLTAVLTFACTTVHELPKIHQLENYRSDIHMPLPDRTHAPPEILLRYLRKLDNKRDYELYMPSRYEKTIIRNAIALLPKREKSVLQNRLIGIYFIKNFTGNGLCEWVLDRSGMVYIFFVFNPSAFGKTASELLTEKENTCFIKDDTSIKIIVDCGKKIPGFYYILLHETAHAADYVLNVTPYVDEDFRKFMNIERAETEFTKNYWIGYNTTKEHFIFSNKVYFYNIGKPKLKISQSVAVYKALSRSPFATLYGSISWAEDLAELAAYNYITHVMGEPFRIYVLRDKKELFSFYPMESPQIIKRLPQLEALYSGGI